MKPTAMTIDQTAATYGWGRTKTYELIRDGKLKAKKLGRRTLVITESADELLQSLPDLKTAA